MREIKYKAYVKELNLVLPVLSIQFDFRKLEVPATYSKYIDTEYFNFEQVELIQYTGLKDKNSKKIYEGDILKFSGNVVALGIVKYNENFATFQACNGNGGWLFGNESGTNIEIIGNIYENQELLKGADEE